MYVMPIALEKIVHIAPKKYIVRRAPKKYIVVENTRDCAYSTPSNIVHNARLRNVLTARLSFLLFVELCLNNTPEVIYNVRAMCETTHAYVVIRRLGIFMVKQ